jgi:hypothetical protein
LKHQAVTVLQVTLWSDSAPLFVMDDFVIPPNLWRNPNLERKQSLTMFSEGIHGW